jgi:sugar/nucleoside kinase (ribokinase family)
MTQNTDFTPDYLVIGHIAHDVTPQGPQLGGTVSFAARTAIAFGLRVGILTSTKPGEPLLQRLPPEATVISVPAEHTTTFENIYSDGVRTQYLYHRAETLTPDKLPPTWRKARLIHLGPIAYEIDPAMVTAFENGRICVTPQGWMRRRDSDGRVQTKRWAEAEQVLSQAALAVMSEEDIRHDPGLETFFAKLSQIMVLTRAERGGTVYQDGGSWDFPAYPMAQVDPTGAGDIFATALHIVLAQSGSLEYATQIAARLAGLSVGRVGVASAPTPQEIAEALKTTADPDN